MSSIFQTISNAVKHWYVPLIFGIIFLVCGIYIFTVPLETYVGLSILFSISFLVSGILEIFFSIQNNKSLEGWGWFLVDGLLSTVVGIYLIAYPGISMTVLPFIIGFTLLFRSFQLLGFAFDMKSIQLINWGNVALTSIIGILFSFLLISSPIFTGISLVTLTAVAFIFVGVSSILLSFDIKKMKNFPEKIGKDLRDRIDSLRKEIDAVAKRK